MTVYGSEVVPQLDSLTVAVFGLGKMGLPLATVMAESGATVHGVDIDETVVSAINDGRSPIENEPGVEERVERYAGTRLDATTDGVEAVSMADITIVVVPTVLDDEQIPELGPVMTVADTISEGVSKGDLILLESTVPPGTTENAFAETVTPHDESLLPGRDFGVAHCPERTYAGQVIKDITESYPKIVGGIDEESTLAAAGIYEQFNQPGVYAVSSATAAEAVKVFEGVYRDVNIALANELAMACEDWGISSSEVFEAANSQPFCHLHEPGIGVGGHCIPVYPYFVMDRTDQTPLLREARAINDSMPDHAISILEEGLEGSSKRLSNSTVLVLGVTYRAGVPETRYAPALKLIQGLQTRGVSVFVHDPLLSVDYLKTTGATPVETLSNTPPVDAVVLTTGHEQYHSLDLDTIPSNIDNPVVVDGRDFFDESQVNGWWYRCIGEGINDLEDVPATVTSNRRTEPLIHPDDEDYV